MTQAPETRYARAADGIHVGYQKASLTDGICIWSSHETRVFDAEGPAYSG